MASLRKGHTPHTQVCLEIVGCACALGLGPKPPERKEPWIHIFLYQHPSAGVLAVCRSLLFSGKSFREQQCEKYNAYNHTDLDGNSLQWVPKYSGVSPRDRCKLFCRARGRSEFKVFEAKVRISWIWTGMGGEARDATPTCRWLLCYMPSLPSPRSSTALCAGRILCPSVSGGNVLRLAVTMW